MSDEPLVRLPSRWEDLDESFRGRLRPNKALLSEVQDAYRSMQIAGGIRFLPIYGESGSGKTSAARELGTHLAEAAVFPLSRSAVEDMEALTAEIERRAREHRGKKLLIALVDQYEEAAAQKQAIPTSFVEALALLDRGELRNTKILFLWLTTSRAFQKSLVQATTRNTRILVNRSFELSGPDRPQWPEIIEETFRFHNRDRSLADFEIIEADLLELAAEDDLTLGAAIERAGERLQKYVRSLHDLSNYQVLMLWPVTDGLRISRIQQFTDPRQGYKLDWNAWYRQLNAEDQRQLPLREYNRTRLYFDFRLIPIAAADLHPLCRDLDQKDVRLYTSYLERFSNTHLLSILKGTWNPDTYSPMRERESQRAKKARDWYESITSYAPALGRRLALILRELGIEAQHEAYVHSEHRKVRTDVLAKREISPAGACIELKAFSAENTMPSTICAQVHTTLRKYAQFVGFVGRQ